MNIFGRILLVIFSFYLFACGGGGNSDTNPTPPPAPNPAPAPNPNPVSTEQIEGNWFTVYEDNQCTEVFTFLDTGKFSIESNESKVSGVYSLGVPNNERQSLTLEFTQQTGGIDCEDSFENVVGLSIDLSVNFPDEESLQIFEDSTSSEVIFSLKLDNPISFSETLQTLDYNSLFELQVTSERPLKSPIRLINAPSNMQIDNNGRITWRPNMPMLDKKVDIMFSVGSDDSIKDISATFELTDDNRARPTVRTESASFNSRWSFEKMTAIGNFDSDFDEELLVIDTGISLYSFNNNELVWKWTYPYHIPFEFDVNISRFTLQTFDAQNDGTDNIYIGVLNQIFMIDGVDSQAIQVYQSDNHFYSFATYDLNEDNQPEFIMIKQNEQGYYIEVFDTGSQSIMYVSDAVPLTNRISDVFFPPRIGNVDGDTEFEIVWSSGQVINALTGETKWQASEPFGTHVVLKDLDADGIDEIVGHRVSGNSFFSPIVWNAQSQSIIASDESNSAFICSVSVGLHQSVYYNFCDADSIVQYALTDGELNVIKSLNVFSFNLSSIITYDTDNDQSDEFLFVDARGGLTLLDLLANDELQANQYPRRSRFNALGFGSVRVGEDAKPIFLSENNGAFEHAISYLQDNGQIITSESIFDMDIGAQGALGDDGNDGFADVLLALERPNRLQYQEVNSSTNGESQLFPFSDFYSGYQVQLHDVNGDGVDDALIANKDEFVILDMVNSDILATQSMPSEPNISSDYDFAFKVNSQNELIIGLSSFSGTSVFRYENERLVLISTSDMQCTSMEFLAQSNNLFCIKSAFSGETYNVFDSNLNVIAASVQDSPNDFKNYFGFVPAPNSDNVYISVYLEGVSGRYVNSIAELNPYTMETIWVSPPVLGPSRKGDIYLNINEGENPVLFFSSGDSNHVTH